MVFYWVLPQVCSKFAQIAVPLTDLTKKSSPTNLVWNQSHDLKVFVYTVPHSETPQHLGIIVFKLRTKVQEQLELLQMVQGQMLPIVNVSRKLKACEYKYATVENECLAIVWTI